MLNKIKTYSFIYKIFLLLLILSITLSLRIYFNLKLPVENRHNYPNHYLNAVSYAAGGLDYDKLKINTKSYMLAGIDHDTKGTSVSKVLDDFLNAKVNTLDIQSLQMYIKGEAYILELLVDNTFGAFDQYVAAFIWKIFGISWRNLFYFYSFLSTLSGLGLFLLGRKITKSYWGGLLVATVYAFSSPELYGGIWSIRDASPVWFFTFVVTFFFVFTGIYKKQWLNYLSYYALGIITLLGIGWRSDALLFFPIIMLFLIIKLYLEKKLQKNTLKNTLLYFILFIFGSYSIMTLNSKLSAPSAPLGFMHIALYADKIRSNIGSYENNFQNEFNDYQTLWQVQHYQKHNYPDENTVQMMQGNYGKYCLELYIKSLTHNIYQWVKTYPRYFYNTFLLQDVILSNTNTFRQTQNKIIQEIWKGAVYLASVGTIILLFIGAYKHTVSFFITFVFYYSIIYWSMLPLSKHIMIMSVPISVLSGIFIFYIFSIINKKIVRRKVKKMIFPKRKFLIFFSSIIVIFISYNIILYITMKYSTQIKNDLVNKIISISKEGKDITTDINPNWKNKFSIDLSQFKPIAVMVEFQTTGEKGLVTVYDQYNKWGKVIPIEYKYNVASKERNHTLFTTCMGFNIDKNYRIKIQLPPNATISRVKLIPLTNWNGTTYGTVFDKNHKSPGAESIVLSNSIKYQLYKKNKNSLFLFDLHEQDFVITAFNNKKKLDLLKKINNQSLLWQSTSNRDHLWNSQHNLNLTKVESSVAIINAVFKKNNAILNQNLFIRLQLYDNGNNMLYKTPLQKIDDIIIRERNTYEVIFDISDIPKEASKFRIYFYARELGKYVIPKDMKIFQTVITDDSIQNNKSIK